MEKRKSLFAVLVVLVFSAISGFSLFHPGLIPTHDGEYHVIRFYQFDKTLRDGDWYPRWQPDLNHGFGSPLSNYYYPLPNYIASFFHFFGLSFIDAFRVQMFLAIVVGGILFFLWSRLFWGNMGGVVSAIFYMFSPYHLVDIYIRGSVGEVWSLAFFPGFLWCITKLIKDQKYFYIFPSSIFLTLVIFSHNILALMFSCFGLAYGIMLITQKKIKSNLVHLFYVFFLTLGLSAIFWMPAIFERSYVIGLQIFGITSNFPEMYQLIFPSWGTGFSSGDLNNQMSFQIGVANLLSTILFIFFVLLLRKKYKENNRLFYFFIFSFVLIFFLMLQRSSWIWENFPFMNYFQFPWRFLSLETLIASFMSGMIFYKDSFLKGRKKILFIFSLLITIAVVLSIGYIHPAYYHDRNDNYYFSRSNFMDGTNTPGNAFNTKWLNVSMLKKSEKIVFLAGKGDILNKNIKSTKYIFDILSFGESSLLVNTAYFPGWQIYVDGKKTKIEISSDGLIEFIVPSGRHMVKVLFLDTPVRLIAKVISVFSFFILCFFLLKEFLIRKNK